MFKRGALLYSFFAFLIGVIIIRLLSISIEYPVSVSTQKSTRKIILSSTRGFIYDRNMEPLVNENVFTDNYSINSDSTIEIINTKRYSSNQLCSHIIGYINGDGEGISGIEKCYNDLLEIYSGEESITCSVNAFGSVIGSAPDIKYDNYLSKGGIVLTIDKTIQRIAEESVNRSSINAGAVVITDVKTSRILACVSVPSFDNSDVGKSVTSDNSPLINRALTSYSVGSVFKPVVAAAALENGISPDTEYTCTGKIKIGDTYFNCHKKDGHGKVNMAEAISVSCNTYFINLTKEMDTKEIINMASGLGIGSRLEIADSMFTDSGCLPDAQSITPGEKANLSFGQGELMATPVHLAAVYSAIANKGVYTSPVLVSSQVDENMNEVMVAKPDPSRRVMSEKTAKIIMESLKKTVEEGSGEKAKPRTVSAAGKTATAQSGWYRDGKEVNHAWFIGIFPVDNPKYVVVILNENGVSGSTDCAPVFKDIAELIIAYE